MASDTSTELKERLHKAFDDNGALINIAREIASDIESGALKLHAFVEELGPTITDKDASKREKGISVLSTVLSDLSKEYLSETELHFMTSFYCDRLKDHHSIIPVVLKGILALVQMRHLPHDAPASLFRVMFEHVPCQSQLLADRRNIYLIFSTLLENRLDDLKSMGPDFVYGVISAIDGERDPRNLILLFTILPQFIQKFPLGHLTEEMFEVISCYFPVDFNPSGAEGMRITRDDLAEKLAPCLCAIPEFAEFCLPLISEKLFSTLKIAKLDSLSLLCKGAPTFGSKGLEKQIFDLWSAVRKELLPGSDIELRNAAVKALMILVSTLSDNPSLRNSFLDKIIVDTKSSLCDVQLSLFRPAEKLLEAVALVDRDSCMYVLRAVIPQFLGQYSTKTSLTDKVLLMETLNNFLKISADQSFSIKSVPELSWTDIPQLYLGELSTQDTELKCKVLLGLSIQKAYLNEVHRETLYNAICKEVEDGSDQTRAVCHSCILSFSILYPQEILRLIKEKLLPDNDALTIKVQTRRLEALSAVAKMRDLGIEVLPEIVSQVNADNFEISFTALSCLHRLVSTKNTDFDIQLYLHTECKIIEKFVSMNIDVADRRMHLICSICRSIIKNLTAEQQQEVVKKYYEILNENSSITSVILILNMLIPLRKNVSLSLDTNLLNTLYNFAVNTCTSEVHQTVCKFLSVALNKMTDETLFQQLISYISEKIAADLQSDLALQSKQAIATLQIWLTKATVTGRSYNVENSLDKLIEILRHDQLGPHIAREYKILTSKNEDALTTENYCNIGFLYKQRVFEHLLRRDSDFKNSSRQNYLTALVELLEEVPIELLFMKLEKLVPLLIESLSLDNEQLVYATLTTLKLLLDSKNPVFTDKIQCFIPRLLRLSNYRTMRVRIAALECLTYYCYYPTIIINIYKQDVLEKLIPILDDRKRLVRRAAVKARTKWFLVGAPGGIKDQ